MNQFPSKNYFTLPNEIFSLGLGTGEIAVYAYLRCLENPSTYQCWPSYATIGKAIHSPHLHPRHSADAAKGCGENGQFHGADSISPTGKQSIGKETVSSPALFGSFRTVRCVGHGVGRAGVSRR